MPISRYPYWIVLLALAAAVLVYANGLNGPFLFDDHVHITQNEWVKIDSLAWPDLVGAWNSSFSPFPTNRPLAQLSFGINHALAGLDPWAFKTTNLAIHLLSGIAIFVLSLLVLRAVSGQESVSQWHKICAALVATIWLLHPMHVSTVLYTVQRMAQLSTLSLFVALSCYLWGRIRIDEGRPGALWILAAVPISILGFLSKESAALLPLLLLVSELTILRTLSPGNRRWFVQGIRVVFIAVPVLGSLVYFAMHPGYFNYDGRPFTLDERALTQGRVLWSYLQWIFVPDISAFGLFHDDIEISKGLINPPATLFALIGLALILIAAILLRIKAPVFAFSVLFFLASHSLESSVFPLEMVFEHRNYLASFGPILLLAYLITIASARMNVRALALGVGALLLVTYAFVTHIRVNNWSSYQSFIFNQAENHPDSARSNFMAGQMLVAAVAESEGNATELADSARDFFNKGIAVDPRCINCMFGLIVLDLHTDRLPGKALTDRLEDTLGSGDVGPTKVSITQFSYLVQWHRSDGIKLPDDTLQGIFEAALTNPGWTGTARAGIESAYRAYWEYVDPDLPKALHHAKAAVQWWPARWHYRLSVVKLLMKLDRLDEALAELNETEKFADSEEKLIESAKIRVDIERGMLK